MIEFIWDEKKNQLNIQKHRVSFFEAKTVFRDVIAKLIYDPDHSHEEDRFLLLGMSTFAKLLVVAHTYKTSNKTDESIRIISARFATKRELKAYKGIFNER